MNSVHSKKETERTAEDTSKNKPKVPDFFRGHRGTFAALMLIGIVAAIGGGGAWCYHQGPCAPSEVTSKVLIASDSRLRRLADKDVAVELEKDIFAVQQVIEGIHTIKAQGGDESLYCDLSWRGGDPDAVAPPTTADVVGFLKVNQPNEVIYGVGDSTVRLQYTSMCNTLGLATVGRQNGCFVYHPHHLKMPTTHEVIDCKNEETGASYRRWQDVTGVSKLVGHFTLFSCTAEWPRSEGAPRRGVTYVYGAESNGQQDWKDETLVADWSRAFERAGGEDNEIAAKPTMIYVNGGLHYFHFGAAQVTSPTAIDMLRAAHLYMKSFLAASYEAAPEARVVLMTTHAVCGAQLRGAYAEELKLMASDPEQFCSSYVGFEGHPRCHLRRGTFCDEIKSTVRTQEECMNTAMAGNGVPHLNQRLVDVVREWRAYAPANQLLPRVADAYAITLNGCAYTGPYDGRHYHPLVPAELLTMFACSD